MKEYCKYQYTDRHGRWDRHCFRSKDHDGKHMYKSGEWFAKNEEIKPLKRLPWFYTLVSSVVKPQPTLWECPLCFAIVTGDIKRHTAYHESRGEEDNGEE